MICRKVKKISWLAVSILYSPPGQISLGENAAGGFGLASFTRTPEGVSTATAFFDAYNNLVQSPRNYKAQEVKDGAGTGGQLQFK
ncbi:MULTISPECIES: hypothetical protein [Methylomonas]|uniref:Uncharacterized protein n=2 Tax=Methylomonas TaxID=416 RepID=A0A140E3R0_9GAMM|nr:MULTISPECIES: hypothetical protein [Methylomonas]AMK75034.1 hypothetical protein JT25_000795 [Methylomonas denitrificans]OAI02530.1 hypothetical protein A1342_01785 [Methylomonas methanica]TCV83152.1 hypothetical protein EDE11_110111 [Methylomonas methanica]